MPDAPPTLSYSDILPLTEAVLAKGGQKFADHLAAQYLQNGYSHQQLVEVARLIIELEATDFTDDSWLTKDRFARIDDAASPVISVLYALIRARTYKRVGKSDLAISALNQCADLLQEVDRHLAMGVAWMLGICYQDVGMMNEALSSYTTAHKIAVELARLVDQANLWSDMAGLYLEYGDPVKALAGYVDAHEILVRAGDARGADVLLINVATATQRLGRHQEAIDIYQEILDRGHLADDDGRTMAVLLNKAIAHRTLDEFDAAGSIYDSLLNLVSDQLPSRRKARILVGSAIVQIHLGNHGEALELLSSARDIYKSIGATSEAYDVDGSISETLWNMGNRSEAIDRLRQAFAEMKKSSFTRVTLSLGKSLHEQLTQVGEYQEAYHVLLDCSEFKESVYSKETERAQELTRIQTALSSEREAFRLREEERRRILHNVLPQHIADRLLSGEKRIAERLPTVGIMFADIVGFTEFAANLQPDVVLLGLEALFQTIDRIVENHRCQRVKTIGDAYMASSGTTTDELEDHAVRLARCALEIINIEHAPESEFKLRIGLHLGPVVAGVMQGLILAYDMWGDTVNVAARLEASSHPGRIHISKQMADALQQSSAADEFAITLRGDTALKGLGMVQTYWLTSADRT